MKMATPKLCVDCKHFIPDPISNNKYGKCFLFITDKSNLDYLVSGVDERQNEYCFITRQYGDMCGKEGKYHDIKMKDKTLE
jgi:hypothetical protein